MYAFETKNKLKEKKQTLQFEPRFNRNSSSLRVSHYHFRPRGFKLRFCCIGLRVVGGDLSTGVRCYA